MVPLDEIVCELLPLLIFFKSERRTDETLGDFCHRKGLDELRRSEANLPMKSKTDC